MVHVDATATPCPSCKGTRAQYTMPSRGAGTAVRTCLTRGCNRKVWIDTSADVARKISPSLELSREWWTKVYG